MVKKSLKVVNTPAKEVRCHVHKEKVVRDCRLKECVFFTSYPHVHNCILVYMAKQDLESLKPIDIGMLKGIPASRVARDLSRATTLMRNGTLEVSNQTEVEPKFDTIMGVSACYCCETPITSKNRRSSVEVKVSKGDAEKVLYCSQECADAHPPQYVAAERKCRSDIKTIVEWATKKYSTLGGLEQALNMNRNLLGYTLKSLLGVDADELYSTTQRVKTRSRSLVRRTGSRPEWLGTFSDTLKPLVEKMEKAHGKVTLDLSHVSNEVQRVIDTI